MSFSLPKGIVVLDVETTISNDGNPFDKSNKLCYLGIYKDDEIHLFDIEYSGQPYGSKLEEIQTLLSDAVCIVGFNLKFDLHWLRHYLPSYRPHRIWDCQLFEFIKSNQNNPYPSLNESCESYGLGEKIGDIAEKYWNKGIDTTEIPEEELKTYLANDLLLTRDLFLVQYKQFEGVRRKLFLLHCKDELVLQEIEYNGLYYDTTESIRRGSEIHITREQIIAELNQLYPEYSPFVNWGSADHISAVLYGGFLRYPSTEIATRTLKSGSVKLYERACIKTINCTAQLSTKRIPETKPTSEWDDAELGHVNDWRIREGKLPFCRIFSTAENVLRNIHTKNKRVKRTIQLILKLQELKKLETTYYYGIPKLMKEMKWKDNMIYGTINQCRVITGRTSSSKPNLQNFDSVLKTLFYSRFNHAN